MTLEDTQRWTLIGILAWCALALSVCHSARVDVQPAPVKILPVTALAATNGQQHVIVTETNRSEPPVWATLTEEVLRAAFPLAIVIAAAWASATFLPPLWDVVMTLFGKNRPAPLAEGGLTIAGALVAGYAAIKPDLKEHTFLVIIIGAFGTLGPLLLGRIKSLAVRVLAAAALAIVLIGLPALAILAWPFFAEKGKDETYHPITSLQAAVEELHKVTPDTLAVLALALAIFAIKVVLSIAQPNVK